MKLIIFLSATILFYSSCTAQNTPFEEYQWKNRLLVFYVSNEAGNEIYKKQDELFKHQHAAFKERDLKGILVLDSVVLKLPQGRKLSASVKECKRFLSIKDNHIYQVSLIGKDGTIKLQSEQPLTTKELYKTIDAMPMRQNEMNDNR